jgi:hypothetical protein
VNTFHQTRSPVFQLVRKAMLLSFIALFGGYSQNASALTIVLNDTTVGGMSANALSGFTQAADVWESVFSDNITLRLDISFAPLGPGILGSTSTESFIQSYSNIRTAIVADSTSASDVIAVANLPAAPSLRLWTTNFSTGAAFLDNNASNNNNFLDISRANAKALGITTNLSGPNIPNVNDTSVKDGTIAFSSSFAFDFDPSNGVTGGTIDFIGVAVHEIGHALGFYSGVDSVDAFSNPNTCPSCGGAQDLDTFAVMNTLDLYRYSANSVANTALSAHQGDPAYFSLNAGATNLALFSTGPFDGDGRQASHWKDSLSLGIMDPTLGFGETGLERNLDLQGLDVIGWNLAPAGLNDSQITVTSGGTLAFGRVMANTSPTAGSVSLGKIGTSATTFTSLANPNYTVSATGNFAGGNQSENIGVDITNGITTTGVKSFNLAIDNTAASATAIGRGRLDSNDSVNVTATAVANRVIGTTNVAFGSVFAGTAVSGNSTLSTTGADNDRTRVTVNGTAIAADANGIGVNAGSSLLFDDAADNTSRTLAGTINTAGNIAGSRSLSTTGEGLANEAVQPVTVNYTATVFDHGTGSFTNTNDPDNPQVSLVIDFGSNLLNSVVNPVSYDIFNLLDTVGFTADIQYSAPGESGDNTVLTTTLQGIGATSLAANSSLPYTASFNTSNIGTYEAIYTLALSDQGGIAGGGSLGDLVLTLRGSVFAAEVGGGVPEPSTGLLLVAGLVCMRRRRRS